MHVLYTNERLTCPACKKAAHSCSSTDTEKPPEDGNCGICSYCGTLNIYRGNGRDLKLEPVPANLIKAKMEREPEYWNVLMNIQQAIRERNLKQ